MTTNEEKIREEVRKNIFKNLKVIKEREEVKDVPESGFGDGGDSPELGGSLAGIKGNDDVRQVFKALTITAATPYAAGFVGGSGYSFATKYGMTKAAQKMKKRQMKNFGMRQIFAGGLKGGKDVGNLSTLFSRGGVLAAHPYVRGAIIIGSLGVGFYNLFQDSSNASELLANSLDGTYKEKTDKMLKELGKAFTEASNSEGLNMLDAVKDKYTGMTRSAALAAAKAIYEATAGLGYGLGWSPLEGGTAEAEIKRIIDQDIPTVMAMSQVSKAFSNLYGDSITFEGNLRTVLQTELDQGEMYANVEAPLADKLEGNFIEFYPTGKSGKVASNNNLVRMGYAEFMANIEAIIKSIEGEAEEANKKNDDKDKKEKKGGPVGPPALIGVDYNNPTAGLQAVMNAYCLYHQIFNIGSEIPITGKQDTATVQLFTKEFLPHVFANNKIFSQYDKAAQIALTEKVVKNKWVSISKILVKDFPGYDTSMEGCLNFAVDAYYSNISRGYAKTSSRKKSKVKKSKSVTSAEKLIRRKQYPEGNNNVSARRFGGLGPGDVPIVISGVPGADSYDDLTGVPGSGSKLVEELIGQLHEGRLSPGEPMTLLWQLNVSGSKLKVKAKGPFWRWRAFTGFGANEPTNALRRSLKNYVTNNDIKQKLKQLDGQKFTITIRFPTGSYDPTIRAR